MLTKHLDVILVGLAALKVGYIIGLLVAGAAVKKETSINPKKNNDAKTTFYPTERN